MIEPLPAMYAAAETVAEGKAAEVELEWVEIGDDGRETRLCIWIRRDVKHLVAPTKPDS
jgi:hypothetical protein